MKKLLGCLLFLSLSLGLYAQECTTTWPYLYSDFVAGKVYYKSGNTESKFLNIYIVGNKLHLIDGEDIVELKSASNLAKVELLEETYLPFENRFYQVIQEGKEGGYLVLFVSGDLRSLEESSGAYGSSANTTSTMNLSSIEIKTRGGGGTINHMELRNQKEGGKSIPLIKKYYFIVGGDLIAAKAKDVENSLPSAEKKKEFKNFVKANKINWKSPADLAKLLEIW